MTKILQTRFDIQQIQQGYENLRHFYMSWISSFLSRLASKTAAYRDSWPVAVLRFLEELIQEMHTKLCRALPPTFGWLVHVNMLVLHVCISCSFVSMIPNSYDKDVKVKERWCSWYANGPLWIARFVAWLPCIIMYHQFCVRLSKPGEIAWDGVKQTMKESIAHRPLLFSIVTIASDRWKPACLALISNIDVLTLVIFWLFCLAMKPPVPLRPASSREMELIKDADSGGETVG